MVPSVLWRLQYECDRWPTEMISFIPCSLFSAGYDDKLRHMKSLSLLLAAVVIAFSLPACASSKKKECCSGSSCSAPDGKAVTGHVHKHKSS